MPISSGHSVLGNEYILSGGTQYITDELVFPNSPNTSTILLSKDIYATGTYVLYDYSLSSSNNPVQNLSQLIIDFSDINTVQSATVFDDKRRRRILLTLNGKSDNGMQYIDGVLSIEGPFVIELSLALYGSPRTYTLFSFSSFSGSLSNITITPPAGRFVDASVSSNGCAISGNTITVTLI